MQRLKPRYGIWAGRSSKITNRLIYARELNVNPVQVSDP